MAYWAAIAGAASSLGGAALNYLGSDQDVELRKPTEEARLSIAAKENYGDQAYMLNLLDALRNPNVAMTGLKGYLTGSAGGTQSVPYQYTLAKNRYVWLDPGEPVPAGTTVVDRDNSGRVQVWVPRSMTSIERVKQYQQAPSEGLLPYLRREINPLTDAMEAESQARRAAYSSETLRAAGPAMLAAYQTTLDPARVRGLELLQQSANEQMAAGGRLDPAIRREYEQAVRAAQAARGRGFGPIDVYEEAFSVGQAAEARRALAQNQMAKVLGVRAALDPDVAGLILGRSGATAGNEQFALQAIGQAGAQGAFDPFNRGDFSDVYSSNANAQNAYNISKSNAAGAQGGAMTSGGLGLIGSYLSTLKK